MEGPCSDWHRFSTAVDFFMKLAGVATKGETKLQLMRSGEMVQVLLPKVEE